MIELLRIPIAFTVVTPQSLNIPIECQIELIDLWSKRLPWQYGRYLRTKNTAIMEPAAREDEEIYRILNDFRDARSIDRAKGYWLDRIAAHFGLAREHWMEDEDLRWWIRLHVMIYTSGGIPFPVPDLNGRHEHVPSIVETVAYYLFRDEQRTEDIHIVENYCPLCMQEHTLIRRRETVQRIPYPAYYGTPVTNPLYYDFRDTLVGVSYETEYVPRQTEPAFYTIHFPVYALQERRGTYALAPYELPNGEPFIDAEMEESPEMGMGYGVFGGGYGVHVLELLRLLKRISPVGVKINALGVGTYALAPCRLPNDQPYLDMEEGVSTEMGMGYGRFGGNAAEFLRTIQGELGLTDEELDLFHVCQRDIAITSVFTEIQVPDQPYLLADVEVSGQPVIDLIRGLGYGKLLSS